MMKHDENEETCRKRCKLEKDMNIIEKFDKRDENIIGK